MFELSDSGLQFLYLLLEFAFPLGRTGSEFLDLLLQFGFPLFGTLELRFPVARLLSLLEPLQQQLRRILKQFFRRRMEDRDQGCHA